MTDALTDTSGIELETAARKVDLLYADLSRADFGRKWSSKTGPAVWKEGAVASEWALLLAVALFKQSVLVTASRRHRRVPSIVTNPGTPIVFVPVGTVFALACGLVSLVLGVVLVATRTITPLQGSAPIVAGVGLTSASVVALWSMKRRAAGNHYRP